MTTQRSGVSLIETIVAVALVILLAAAFIPNLLASTDRLRVAHAALTLETIMDAMTDARLDNQDWPGRVSQLTTGITTADQNACGSFYNPGRVQNWDGPYLDQFVPPAGLPLGIGFLQDPIARVVLSGGGRGQISELKLVVEGAAEEDVLELSRLVDGNEDPAGPTIRWTPPTGGELITFEWVRTVKGC